MKKEKKAIFENAIVHDGKVYVLCKNCTPNSDCGYCALREFCDTSRNSDNLLCDTITENSDGYYFQQLTDKGDIAKYNGLIQKQLADSRDEFPTPDDDAGEQEQQHEQAQHIDVSDMVEDKMRNFMQRKIALAKGAYNGSMPTDAMNDAGMFISITNQMLETFVKKNHDYGNSFHETFCELGIISAVSRMNDKMQRIKSLARGTSPLVDESMEDTLMDLANYSILTLIEIQKAKK